MSVQPIPVLLLTGFLGAGKTTLLNRLLASSVTARKKLAVIENEFGTLSVDSQLLRPGSYARFDLNRGSLFCICIKTDFLKTLATIATEIKPELVVVEATGVADPCDLEGFIDAPHLKDAFEIRANLCIVDASNFTKVVAFMKAAANQVRWGDGIIINKSDLVKPTHLDRLNELIGEMNPAAPRICVDHGAIPDGFIERLTHVARRGAASERPPQSIVSVSFSATRPISRRDFESGVASLKGRLLRLKGTSDFGNGPVWIESVFDEVSEGPAPAGAMPGAAFTVIAWKAGVDEIREAFGFASNQPAPINFG